MPDKGSAHEKEEQTARGGSAEVKLALIQHASRPLAIVAVGLLLVGWLSCNRSLVFDTLDRTELLRVAWFEVKLREDAQAANLEGELRKLKSLTEDQIQLFLIIAGSRQPIRYDGPELNDRNLNRLKELGLVQSVDKVGETSFTWTVSEDAHSLHRLIFNVVADAVRRSADAPRREAS